MVIIIAPTIANNSIKLAINIHILWLVYKILPMTDICPASAILLSQLLLAANITLVLAIFRVLLI